MPAEVRSPTPEEVALISKVYSEKKAAETGEYRTMMGVWVLAIVGREANDDEKFLLTPWIEGDTDPWDERNRSEADPHSDTTLQRIPDFSMCFVSGGIDERNTPKEQAVIEMREELGLEISTSDLSDYELPYGSRGTTTVQSRDHRIPTDRTKTLIYGQHVFALEMSERQVEHVRRRNDDYLLHRSWMDPMTAREAFDKYHSRSTWLHWRDRRLPMLYHVAELYYDYGKLPPIFHNFFVPRMSRSMPKRLRRSTQSLLEIMLGIHPTVKQRKV